MPEARRGATRDHAAPCAVNPSAPLSPPRRLLSSKRHGRAGGALLLAATIFALAILTGPHLIEHLLGAGGDSDHCLICLAIHGTRSGAHTVPLALAPALPIVRRPATDQLLAVSIVSPHCSTPRAPPTIG